VVGANPSHYKGDQLPVENVSWDDAKAYCEGVGMRLPTEAEWEYAARGGSPAARYGPLVRIAWYDGNSSGTPHEVGQKQANAYGLYDMLGNVVVWVNDWYDENYYHNSPSQDPSGPPSGQYRVVRSGCWACKRSDIRVSFRAGNPANFYNDYGVRCAGELGNP
jgi:formylglycine-generating enzyme required for sulfatase activity